MTDIKRTNFDGDPNLGLHAETTDEFCIMDPGLSEGCYRPVEEVLEVGVVKTAVSGSSMPGIFCAANSKGIALPRNVEEVEKERLEELGLDYKVIKSRQTALGNLILVNDDVCFISERLEDVKEDLENLFGVPVYSGTVAGTDLMGSSSVVTNQGLLCHRDVTDGEMDLLEEKFGLECGRGTVNFGVPFVGACIIANSKGVLVSEGTTGPELGRIEQALILQSG
ncbi:MAG: translation initiation factor IF-6 [Candidatus Aenigmatarchaeota archaeon]